MSRRRQTALIATGVITAAASLAACGSPITMNTSWQSLASLTSTTKGGVNTLVLNGPLLHGNGKPISKTNFRETCTQIAPLGEPAPAYRCIASVNTGKNIYVAGGDVANPFGRLHSLALPATIGSITITNLTTPNGKAQMIGIYAAKGLNGNNLRLSSR